MTDKHAKFCVTLDCPIAVYIQIENQVQFAIASGRYGPGDRLPSVREMAETLNVNPNTVTKAYRDLELMGLVHTRRGVGVTIAEQAPPLCQSSVRVMVTNHLRDAVAECMACGCNPRTIQKMVAEVIASGAAPYDPSLLHEAGAGERYTQASKRR